MYRRWPTKAELVADAVREHTETAVPIPDSGTLEEDLRRFARDIAANIGTPHGGTRTRSLVAATTTNDEMAARMHDFWAERLLRSSAIIERAVERGDLPAGVDANLIIETVIGPLWVRLLLTGEPISEDLADEVVALVANGLPTTT